MISRERLDVRNRNTRRAMVAGVLPDPGEVAAYGSQVDARFESLDQTMINYFNKKWGATSDRPFFVFKSSLQSDEAKKTGGAKGLTAEFYAVDRSFPVPAGREAEFSVDANFFDAWEADYRGWKVQWFDIVDSRIAIIGAQDNIGKWDATQRVWVDKTRAAYPKMGVPESPPAPKPPGGGGIFPELDSTLGKVVWYVGVGFALYVGLFWIAPTLLGATARTKQGYQALRNPNPTPRYV